MAWRSSCLFSIFKRVDVLLGKRDLAPRTNQRCGGMGINQASACHGGSARRTRISWTGTPGPGNCTAWLGSWPKRVTNTTVFVLVLGGHEGGSVGDVPSLLTLIQDIHKFILRVRGACRCQSLFAQLLHVKTSRSDAFINNCLGFV